MAARGLFGGMFLSMVTATHERIIVTSIPDVKKEIAGENFSKLTDSRDTSFRGPPGRGLDQPLRL